MKTSIVNSFALVLGVILLAAGGPWLVRELRTLPKPHALAARAGERVVTLDVAGMTCSGCAARVREELTAVRGVTTAEVRLSPRRAYVVCDRSLADSLLTAAIERAGPGFAGAVVAK